MVMAIDKFLFFACVFVPKLVRAKNCTTNTECDNCTSSADCPDSQCCNWDNQTGENTSGLCADICGSGNFSSHGASFGHIKIRPTRIESLTHTEDYGDDEISIWIGDGPLFVDDGEEKKKIYLRKDNTNYFQKSIGKGESHDLVGKASEINGGKAVFIHLGEHDLFSGDISEYGDADAQKTPEVPAETVTAWLTAFNENVSDKITFSRMFKFDTFGKDDLPFAEEITKNGFLGWVQDLALDVMCMDAIDIMLIAVSGGAASVVGKQVTAAMARQGYKEATKALGRKAVEEATKKAVKEAGMQIRVATFGDTLNTLLDKTEFCLFPDLAKGNSDPMYRVTFEVTPGIGIGTKVAGGAEQGLQFKAVADGAVTVIPSMIVTVASLIVLVGGFAW